MTKKAKGGFTMSGELSETKSKIGCKRCGTCCSIYVQVIKGGSDELLKLRKGFKKILEYEGERFAIFRMPCKYITKGGCRIYANRPEACKTFPEPEYMELHKKTIPECGYNE